MGNIALEVKREIITGTITTIWVFIMTIIIVDLMFTAIAY
jgi:hypothetical protein